MRCQYLSLAVALCVVRGWALSDLEDSIRAEFGMAMLSPRDVQNLQTFSGALGGVKASAITNSGDPTRPFEVDGSTFVSGLVTLVWMGGQEAGISREGVGKICKWREELLDD